MEVPDTQYLLAPTATSLRYGTVDLNNEDLTGNGTKPEPPRRQIGVFSAVFMIFNRIIGTGYAFSVTLEELRPHKCEQDIRNTRDHSRF